MITCRSPDIRTGLSTKEVDVVVTPRVREEVRYQLWMAFRPIFFAQVRKHFGCDKLSGAELEDQGEEGTALTHWEKRLFENEAMTGTHTQVGIINDHQKNMIVDLIIFQNPIYSRITMALMEDTGW